MKLLFSFLLFSPQDNHFWTAALQPLAGLTGLKEHEVSALRFFSLCLSLLSLLCLFPVAGGWLALQSLEPGH